jgi:hypothetical protein
MRERAHWNWSIISRHATEFVTRNQRGLSAGIGCTKRGNYSGRATSNYQNVDHLLKYPSASWRDFTLAS